MWAPSSPPPLPASGRATAPQPVTLKTAAVSGVERGFFAGGSWPGPGRGEQRKGTAPKVTGTCFSLTKGELIFLRSTSRQRVYFCYLQSAVRALANRQAHKEGRIPVTVHDPTNPSRVEDRRSYVAA